MPSKVKFQTEYMSTFNKNSHASTQGNKSPVLKPRSKQDLNQLETEKPGILKNKEAGLCSVTIHPTHEPPLQRKRITDYDFNHNIMKTNTTKWRDYEETSKGKVAAKNPIMDYEAVVQKSKQDIGKENPKNVTADKNNQQFPIEDRFAGKTSDHLRYLALEPPMQRKRTSPYKLNHNILKTNTVKYVNGSNGDSETSNEVLENTDRESDLHRIKRKLNFHNEKNSDENVNLKLAKAKEDNTEVQRSFPTGKGDDDVKVIRQLPPQNSLKKKILSPTKQQRKQDLEELNAKQNERVDRALRIKAGLQTIEPPLYSHPLKSEYQREFAWKKPVMVHKSVIAAGRSVQPDNYISENKVKVKKQRRKTEYQEQFQKYQSPSISQDAHLNEEKPQIVAQQSRKNDVETKGKLQDSPDKRLIQPSQNAQPLFFPHSGYDKLRTEYKSNFQSPTKFELQNGAWKDAAPPQLFNNRHIQENKKDHSDWFKEVLHLRNKAEKYKVRARETHYPTTFLASLENEESESSRNSSRKSSADSNSGGHFVSQHRETRAAGKDSLTAVGDRNGFKNVEEGAENAGESVEGDGHLKESHEEEHDVGVAAEEEDSSRPSTSSTVQSDNNLFKARIDSARLAGSAEHRRHNLDRTTPLRSGTVVQSPPKKFSSEIAPPLHDFRSPAKKPSRRNPSTAWAASNAGENKEVSAVVLKKMPLSQAHGKNVALGKKDSSSAGETKRYRFHDYEDKENDQALVLSDIEIVPDVLQSDSSARKNVKFDEFEKPPRAFVQPSDVGRTYALDNSNLDLVENEILSEASLSARDSIISDVLERSRTRRDSFW